MGLNPFCFLLLKLKAMGCVVLRRRKEDGYNDRITYITPSPYKIQVNYDLYQHSVLYGEHVKNKRDSIEEQRKSFDL